MECNLNGNLKNNFESKNRKKGGWEDESICKSNKR